MKVTQKVILLAAAATIAGFLVVGCSKEAAGPTMTLPATVGYVDYTAVKAAFDASQAKLVAQAQADQMALIALSKEPKTEANDAEMARLHNQLVAEVKLLRTNEENMARDFTTQMAVVAKEKGVAVVVPTLYLAPGVAGAPERTFTDEVIKNINFSGYQGQIPAVTPAEVRAAK